MHSFEVKNKDKKSTNNPTIMCRTTMWGNFNCINPSNLEKNNVGEKKKQLYV